MARDLSYGNKIWFRRKRKEKSEGEREKKREEKSEGASEGTSEGAVSELISHFLLIMHAAKKYVNTWLAPQPETTIDRGQRRGKY